MRVLETKVRAMELNDLEEVRDLTLVWEGSIGIQGFGVEIGGARLLGLSKVMACDFPTKWALDPD